MSTRKVRIAQAGIANHGRTILNAIRDSGNLQLVSCYDPNTSASAEVAKEFSIKIAASYEAMINDPDVEAVALVTPNHLHAEQIRKAVAVKKAVFVEKPITTSVAEGIEVIGLMNKAGLPLLVGHNTRRRLVFRRAKTLLDEKRIGKIVAVEANLSRPAGLQPGVPAWKTDPSISVILPMMQLGIHFIDTIHFLLGPVSRVGCFAAHVAMPGSVLDSATAILQLSAGISVSLNSYYVSADAYFFRIYGTEGTIHCSPTKLRLELLKNGEFQEAIEEDFSAERAESYILEMREFGECVLSGKKPETGGVEGLQALAVIEAMAKSVNTRSIVDVKDIYGG